MANTSKSITALNNSLTSLSNGSIIGKIVKTSSYPKDMTISNGATTKVASITIPKGIWIITASLTTQSENSRFTINFSSAASEVPQASSTPLPTENSSIMKGASLSDIVEVIDENKEISLYCSVVNADIKVYKYMIKAVRIAKP